MYDALRTGAPVQALRERLETEVPGVELLAEYRGPPTTPEAVQRQAHAIDQIQAEQAWRRSQSAKMTKHEPGTLRHRPSAGDGSNLLSSQERIGQSTPGSKTATSRIDVPDIGGTP